MIPLFKVYMSDEIDKPLLETIKSGWIGQCQRVEEFETILSGRFQNPNCLTLSAGTHGLHLALRLANVGPGDKVVTSPLSCSATAWPILMQGADIVWADIQENTLNIDPFSIFDIIYNYPIKAVISMHWGGYPCDLEEINKLAETYKFTTIEDAAHATGSTYKKEPIGNCKYSDFTMFSLQAIKILTSVDGGILFCKHKSDHERAKLLRWYGIDREGPSRDLRCAEDIKEFGYKYHMNDVCATVGLINFKTLDWRLKRQEANANYYRNELKSMSGLALIQKAKDRTSSNWLFTILVENRSEFFKLMAEKGIGCSQVHARIDNHSCVADFKRELPVLDSVIDKVAAIPTGWWVTEEDREYIVDVIRSGW